LFLAAILWPLIARAVTEEESPTVHSSDVTGLALVSTRDLLVITRDTPDTSGVRAYTDATMLAYIKHKESGGALQAIQEYAKEKVTEKWSEHEWESFNSIVYKESRWNDTAQNPNSTAHGLCQFLKSTYAIYGGKTDNPERQIDMCLEYVFDRYNTPSKALAFHIRNGWY